VNTAKDIINYAEQHDIHIVVRDGQLILNAPKVLLTDEFLASAKAHKVEILEILSQQELLIKFACQGLEITPTQFMTICNEEDIEYIRKGSFSVETLRAYAASFAEGIHTGRISFHPTINELMRHT
jgi:hypothetical protein